MRYSSGHWKTDTLSHSSEFEKKKKKKDLRTVIRMTLRSTSQIGKWSKIYNVLNVLIYLFINVSRLGSSHNHVAIPSYFSCAGASVNVQPWDTCGSVALDVYFTLTASDSHTALSLSWHLSVSVVQVSVTLIAVSVWFSTHYSLLFFFLTNAVQHMKVQGSIDQSTESRCAPPWYQSSFRRCFFTDNNANLLLYSAC